MIESATWEQYADTMMAGYPLQSSELSLSVGECLINVKSNSAVLLDKLRAYFRHVVAERSADKPDIEVVAVQREPVVFDLPFRDWKRETGKKGRKDAYHDFSEARLVYKVRTGMMFLQSSALRIAAGDCLANDNQVINFINAQYMNWLQQHDWLICHAAGVVHQDKAVAIAAFSGGGKSTSMLRCLDVPGTAFMSNDRLFIHKQQGAVKVMASGVPKLPRINPGTIVTNPVLQHMLSAQRRHELMALPEAQLWELEEKYDVDVLATYGQDRIRHVAPLSGFVILNWQHNGGPMTLNPVDPGERRDLLPALMKSPGPFYQKSNGDFYSDDTPLDEQAYLATLEGVPVYEVSGGVDFDGLVQWYRDSLA